MSGEFRSNSESKHNSGQDVGPIDHSAADAGHDDGATDLNADTDYDFGSADDRSDIAPVTVTPADDRGTGPLPNNHEPRATGVTNGPRMNSTPDIPATNDPPPLAGAWGFGAAMAGTLLGMSLPALAGGNPTANLIGMLVGATASVLVTLAGPLHRLRTSIGVIAAVIAVVFTYVLGQAGEQKAFPPLKDIGRDIGVVRPDPTPTVTPPDEPGTIGPVDGVAMKYGPVEIDCGTGPECGQMITLTSVGTQPLKIADIAFEEGNLDDFSADEDDVCRGNATLAKGDECAFAVRFEPTPGDENPRHATLVIHQNVGSEQAKIAVSGTAPVVDDVGMEANVTCRYRAGPPRELILAFDLDRSGNTEGSSVKVTATHNGIALASHTFSPSDTHELTIPEPPMDSPKITLATPDDNHPENNSVTVTAMLAADTPSGSIDCPTGA